MHRILLALGFLISNLAHAQPSSGSSAVNKQSFHFGYQTSPDRARVAFYDLTADGKCAFSILNLRDFSVQRVSALACGATLMPDFKGQYIVADNNAQNRDSTKLNFKLYYSPDGSAEKRRIYEDGTHYPFGATPDGKLVVAAASVYQFQNLNHAGNLQLFDPVAGTAVKTLRKGPLLPVAEGSLSPAHPYGRSLGWWLTPTALVMATKTPPLFTQVFPLDGKPVKVHQNPAGVYYYNFADTLLLGGSYNPQEKKGRLVLVGITGGVQLLDTTYAGGALGRGYLVQDGQVWGIEPGTNHFVQWAPKDGRLQLLKTYPLTSEGVSLPDILFHSLHVSPKADRIAVLPKYNPAGGQRDNTGYIWEMSSGKLLHVISPFYSQPSAAAAPTPVATAADPCADAIAGLSVKPGGYIMEVASKSIIRVTGYDCKSNFYKVLSPGQTYEGRIYKWEVDNGKYKSVRTQPCPKCGGGGSATTTREYEQTDKGIYYKYTKRGTVTDTRACAHCRGAGVVVY